MRAVLKAAGFLAATILTAAAAPVGATELLTNGGFEDSGSASLQYWGGYTYGASYSLPLPGWTVDTGSVDIVVNNSPWSPAYEGTHALDINGFGPGSISQSFLTQLGRSYRVFYAYSRNAAGANDPATATVSVAGITVPISVPYDPQNFGSPYNILWKTNSFHFTGTGNLETLRLSTTDGGAGGVFFDAVSVGVPEPATWALMIGGFGMAGVMLRGRRTPVAA